MSVINPIEGELMSAERTSLPEPPMEINDSVDPLDVIKTTQSIRLAMVKKHLLSGTPEVGSDSRDFMQLLRDLDSAALTTRKIDVEERQVDESQRLANAQNELLRMLGGKNPFAVDISAGPTPARVERETPVLPEPKLVPDITAQGTQAVNYEDFVSAVEESERMIGDDED